MGLGRKIGLALFAAYLGLLVWVTFNPEPIDGSGVLRELVAAILNWAAATDGYQWLEYNTLEGIGNVLLYVPLGFGLVLIAPRHRWFTYLALGIATTSAAELAQRYLLPDRISAWQDVVNNSIGAALGVLGAKAVMALRSKLRRTSR